MATEETTITELELAEEVLADMVIPVDTSTDTKSVSLKQLRAWLGSSLPTGFILPAVGKINDERFTLLDGKTLSKQGTYGAFCAKVEEQVQASNWFACTEEEYNADISAYGQCGKFVIGTDYVRIPTITRFIGATITLSEIGKTYKESLPNIEGELRYATDADSKYMSNSLFKLSESTYPLVQTLNLSATNQRTPYFDASLSSSTYQDGAKVQPDHTKYPYYMVISTEGQTANVEIDINKVYEDMELKANTSLSNVTANIDFVVESYNDGVNWYKVYKSGWVEQGGRYQGYDTSNVGIYATVNLLKPFANADYKVTGTADGSNYMFWLTYDKKYRTTTSFQCGTSYHDGSGYLKSFYWFACGQGAEKE